MLGLRIFHFGLVRFFWSGEVGILIPSVGILIGSVGILNCRDYDCRDFDCRDFDIDPDQHQTSGMIKEEIVR